MGLSIEPITIAGEREILFPTSTTRFTGSPRSTALRLLFDQRSESVARRSSRCFEPTMQRHLSWNCMNCCWDHWSQRSLA